MKETLLISILLTFSTLTFGQFIEGYATSNYAGVNGINFNPASIVDSRTKLDINFFSLSTTIDNNFLGLTTNFPNPLDSTLFEIAILNNNGQPKNAFMNLDILGPSALYTINEKKSIGFTSQYRSLANFKDVDEGFANLYYDRYRSPQFINQEIVTENMQFSTATWNEYGLVYGQEIYRHRHHWFSLGGKIKLTQGLQCAGIDLENVSFQLNPDSSLTIAGENITYVTSSNLNLGWQNNLSKFNGIGVGMDLGFNYEWRAQPDSNTYEMNGVLRASQEISKHKLRIGFTLSDIGFVKFKSENNGRFNAIMDNLNVLNYDLTRLHGFEQIISENFDVNNSSDSYSMPLPTAMSAQIDYNIHKGFYLNATAFYAVNRKQPLGINYSSRITITPRWDWRWMGIYAPLSLTSQGNQHFGINMMIGPFIIGTRDLGTFLWKDSNFFGNIHIGVKVTSLHFRPSDMDNDGVSDEQDECPKSPGIWLFKGCPDSDGDSIPDKHDQCPELVGLKIFTGCPDTDGDMVADIHDHCPTVAGIQDFKGCPDSDGDGITDAEDNCPFKIGLAIFHGCPDSDGDSIIDRRDACPDLMGKEEHLGCPDSDKDGLYNYEDSCVFTAGPQENNGCPYQDIDGDGILDNKDKCPNQFGPKINNGCPLKDQDYDGIIDRLDHCPQTPGDSSNGGCPVLEEEEEEIIEFAFKNLEFETGKAIIKPESFPSLDALAELLNTKNTWRLILKGHTDSVGDAQINLVLSKKRVEQTKTYLIGKGVIKNKITTQFFGETQPIAPNTTDLGRQKNRRVEMEITFN